MCKHNIFSGLHGPRAIVNEVRCICLSRLLEASHMCQLAIPVHLLLQGRQPFWSLLSGFKIKDLVQQGILLKVHLESFCQKAPQGIQLDCAH